MNRVAQASLAVAVAVAVGFGMVGCGDELYGECSLEAEAGDSLEHCVDDDESEEVSCVVGQHLECETGNCARYRSSDPFCTSECTDDDDCPGGACREFVMRTGQNYCVPDRDLEDPADAHDEDDEGQDDEGQDDEGQDDEGQDDEGQDDEGQDDEGQDDEDGNDEDGDDEGDEDS